MQKKISNYMYNMGLPGFNQVFTGRLEPGQFNRLTMAFRF